MKTTRRQLLTTAACSLGGWGVAALCGCESERRRDAKPGRDTWRSLRPVPTARTEVGAAELGGRLFVAGGYLRGGETVATVEAYDAGRDVWETAVPLPAPRNHLTLASLRGRLFAVGGNDGIGGEAEKPSALVWAWEPGDKKWEAASPLSAPRAAHAAATDGDRLYIVGGVGPDPLPTLIYDPKADRWTEAAPIPTERDHLGAAFVGGKAVAVAGRTGEKEQNVVEAYDPKTDAWETLPPLPAPRHGLCVVGIGNTVYAVGGETFGDPERTFATNEALDIPAGKWTALAPMPTARHGAGGVSYNGRLYILAGGPQPDLAVTNAAEVYLPEITGTYSK